MAMGETHDSSEKRADSKTHAFDQVVHFRRRTEPHAPAMSPPIRTMASRLRLPSAEDLRATLMLFHRILLAGQAKLST